MSVQAKVHYTSEEYLSLEREAEYKNEYINGQIYAMSGAGREHNLIAGNVFGELRTQLRESLCEVYTSDMRVRITPTGMYTYPDAVAACEEPQFEDDYVDTLLNPSVIVEVLSPTTEAYDRGEKLAHYIKLESLSDYILISQNKVRVEHYTRLSPDSDRWVLTLFGIMDSVLNLDSINCSLSLRDTYDKVKLPDVAEDK